MLGSLIAAALAGTLASDQSCPAGRVRFVSSAARADYEVRFVRSEAAADCTVRFVSIAPGAGEWAETGGIADFTVFVTDGAADFTVFARP